MISLSRRRVHTGKGFRKLDMRAIAASEALLESFQQHPKVTIVDKVDVTTFVNNCRSEYGTLTTVVVSLPTYLDWNTSSPINEAEAANQKPDRLEAVMQHTQLIAAYLAHGVNVVVIKPDPSRLEGVYTRDIGFVIGNKCFRANMVANARKPEQNTVEGAIVPPSEVQIEGGNVLLKDGTDNIVFLGIGRRTNLEAVEWLQAQVGTDFEVKPIFLTPETLHIDCAFGPIHEANGRGSAGLIHPSSFVDPKQIELIEKVYGKVHVVSEVEYHRLGANISFIDPDTGILPTECPNVRSILVDHGIEPIEMVLKAIIDAEGAGRCSTFPLLRE